MELSFFLQYVINRARRQAAAFAVAEASAGRARHLCGSMRTLIFEPTGVRKEG
jgi:hypothetical protein